MKLIKTCKDCGYFKYTNPTNTMFHGAAICEYESKIIKPPYAFPEWCHIEDSMQPHPVSEIPHQADDCSVEVLIEAQSGFYVGYYYDGDWYDAMDGDKLEKDFTPYRWYYLPERMGKP